MSNALRRVRKARHGSPWWRLSAGLFLFAALTAGCGAGGLSTDQQRRAAHPDNATEDRLADFDWLVGTWSRLDVKPGQAAFETWTKSSTSGLSGIGATLRGEDTLFVETMGLVDRDGEVFFSANVSHNESTVYFQVTQHTDSSFVSENADHDFPTKIAYSAAGDRLAVVISGGDKAIPFRFVKLSDD